MKRTPESQSQSQSLVPLASLVVLSYTVRGTNVYSSAMMKRSSLARDSSEQTIGAKVGNPQQVKGTSELD